MAFLHYPFVCIHCGWLFRHSIPLSPEAHKSTICTVPCWSYRATFNSELVSHYRSYNIRWWWLLLYICWHSLNSSNPTRALCFFFFSLFFSHAFDRGCHRQANHQAKQICVQIVCHSGGGGRAQLKFGNFFQVTRMVLSIILRLYGRTTNSMKQKKSEKLSHSSSVTCHFQLPFALVFV